MRGRNSAVECQLPKLEIVGSIPAARSKLLDHCRYDLPPRDPGTLMQGWD